MRKNLTTLEIVGIAIQAEEEAVKYYRQIRRLTRIPSLKNKLKFLIGEEQKHSRILADFYRRKFPDVRLVKPASSLVPKPVVQVKGKITILGLLKVSMKAELAAEKFYLDLAGRINDTRSRLLLKYLAKVEKSHHALLKNELDLIVAGSRIKELKAMYQGDRALHVGP
ncbi:MAG: ferritin family protein [Planctomycetes bacterium]|nr:ferritin family protein [Planctomycetota bacterium]